MPVPIGKNRHAWHVLVIKNYGLKIQLWLTVHLLCGEQSANTEKDVDRSENVNEPYTNDCFTNCGYENLHGKNRMCHNKLRSHLKKKTTEKFWGTHTLKSLSLSSNAGISYKALITTQHFTNMWIALPSSHRILRWYRAMTMSDFNTCRKYFITDRQVHYGPPL